MRLCLKSVCWTFVLAFFASFASNAHGLDLKSQIDPLVQPSIDDGKMVGCVVGIMPAARRD